MSLTLNTNVASLNTQNWLSVNTAAQAKATQELSSGYKLNSAADDPAGYAIAFKLGVKSAVLQTATNNANQGTAMLQVAQGAMQQIGNILTQLKQIATEASSANNASDLNSLDNQRSALETQIDNINSSTAYSGSNVFGAGNTAVATDTPTTGLSAYNVAAFSAASGAVYTLTATATTVTMTSNAAGTPHQTLANVAPTGLNTSVLNFTQFGIQLTVNKNQASLAGTLTVTRGAGNLTFQAGDMATAANQVSVSLGNVDHTTLGITGDVSSAANAQAYMGAVDTAIGNLDLAESGVGNAQDQLGYQTANLQTMNQNTQAAASAIKDTDYAKSMSDFAKYQIATQAGVAMLSQANQLPQQILSLIKNG